MLFFIITKTILSVLLLSVIKSNGEVHEGGTDGHREVECECQVPAIKSSGLPNHDPGKVIEKVRKFRQCGGSDDDSCTNDGCYSCSNEYPPDSTSSSGDKPVEQAVLKAPETIVQTQKNLDNDEEGTTLNNWQLRERLGRSTWILLHTMGARYPLEPSLEHQQTTQTFMTNLSRLFPCPQCAREFRELLKEDPPKVATREVFSQWLCQLHNKVNARLKKPLFNCENVNSHYDCGCSLEALVDVHDQPAKDAEPNNRRRNQ